VLAERCRQAARWRANGARAMPPTPGQLARLDQLGCDHAQGYLFARSETASRVGELLGHDRRWQ